MNFRNTFNTVIDPLITGVIANDEVIFTPGDSHPHRTDKTVKVLGIFEKAFIESNGMEAYVPIFKGNTVDLIGAKHTNGNSMIEHGTDKYKVVKVEHDDTGKTMLQLQAQQ